MKLDVVFTPAGLGAAQVHGKAVFVIDVLRAGTTICAALSAGARAVVPAASVEEAIGKAIIMSAPGPGGLGGTYARSPIVCAAGLAVLEGIEQENLCARATALGDLMVGVLRDLQREIPAIGEVRNLGAMVAMELVKSRDPHAPDPDLTKALTGLAAEKGLVLLSCGLYGNVIRFLVPLTPSDAFVREGLGIVAEALRELTSSVARVVNL